MSAIEKAMIYVHRKPRSRYQVEKYLREKEYGEEEIADTLKLLEEYFLIDDLSFAKMYFELGFEKGHGVARIRRELGTKGVDKDTIDQAYEKLENVPDEHEVAMMFGMREVEGIDLSALDFEKKQKLRARIARRLAARGYSSDVAYSVAKKVTDESTRRDVFNVSSFMSKDD